LSAAFPATLRLRFQEDSGAVEPFYRNGREEERKVRKAGTRSFVPVRQLSAGH
jgi:hypothetical protein